MYSTTSAIIRKRAITKTLATTDIPLTNQGRQQHQGSNIINCILYRDASNSRDAPNRREANISRDACISREANNITSNSKEASNSRIPATAGTTPIVEMQAISGHQQ